MASATPVSGVDATFYITAPGFAWADLNDRAAWEGNPTFGGWDNASSGRFWNAEKFNTAAFDVYQELTGLKPGAYKLTAQGFYRNGTTNDRNAILYANSFETPLVSIRTSGATEIDTAKGLGTDNDGIYVPNSQSDAAKAFNAGLYNNELYFVVGEGGTLRVGVKKTAEATNDWAVFDNFQLTYYGTTIPVTLGDLGWATLYTPYALDFDGTGLTAYTASLSEGIVTLTEETDVPANTGVVLSGDAGSYNIPTIASSETDKGELTGNATEATAFDAVAGHTYYVLAPSEDANYKVQFRPVTSGSIAAGKAFLDIASGGSSSVKAFNVVFNDLATGINELTNGQQPMANGPIFNLAGQRMSKLQRGVNIVNGKKVLVK